MEQVVNECVMWCQTQINLHQYAQLEHVWLIVASFLLIVVYRALVYYNVEKLRHKANSTTQFIKAKRIIEKIKKILLDASMWLSAGFIIYNLWMVF